MSEELTQQLPGDILRRILARLDSIDSRLDSMGTRLDGVEARLGSVETRLDSMDAKLTALEDKVDRRLQETRPIWEAVLEQLKEVNARLDRVEKEIISMRRWSRHTFAEMSVEYDNLEERVDKIEERLAPQETPTT